MATPDLGANLLDMFFAAAARGGDRPFLWAKRDGQWQSTSYAEAARRKLPAAGQIALGRPLTEFVARIET